MKKFKKWTPEERNRSLQLTKRARSLGLLSVPCKCTVCGQTEGIIQSHNTNYDVTLLNVPKMLDGSATPGEIADVNKVLKHLCWRCHQMYHSQFRAPYEVRKYFQEIKNGRKWPPVFKHDFGILRRDHNIQ